MVFLSMTNKTYHPIIQEIEKVLRDEYTPGFADGFVSKVKKKDLELWTSLQKEYELPELLLQYYEWAMEVEFPESEDFYSQFEEPFGITSIKDIKDYIEFEKQEAVDIEMPEYKYSGFLDGFFIISKWGNAEYFVIDTLGKLGTKGAIVEFDLDWGNNNEVYNVRFATFEDFLKTVLALLKAKICINPPNFGGDGEATKMYPNDKWFYGEIPQKQLEIERELNPDQYRIDWKTGEKTPLVV